MRTQVFCPSLLLSPLLFVVTRGIRLLLLRQHVQCSIEWISFSNPQLIFLRHKRTIQVGVDGPSSATHSAKHDGRSSSKILSYSSRVLKQLPPTPMLLSKLSIFKCKIDRHCYHHRRCCYSCLLPACIATAEKHRVKNLANGISWSANRHEIAYEIPGRKKNTGFPSHEWSDLIGYWHAVIRDLCCVGIGLNNISRSRQWILPVAIYPSPASICRVYTVTLLMVGHWRTSE